MGLSQSELAERIGVTLNQIVSYENGHNRKTMGSILEICQRCNLSSEWLLEGEGQPFRTPGEPNAFDPLQFEKGAGIRKSSTRRHVEEGTIDSELLEFVLAVDQYKVKNDKKFPTTSDMFQVIRYLGYRKMADLAPHISCSPKPPPEGRGLLGEEK